MRGLCRFWLNRVDRSEKADLPSASVQKTSRRCLVVASTHLPADRWRGGRRVGWQVGGQEGIPTHGEHRQAEVPRSLRVSRPGLLLDPTIKGDVQRGDGAPAGPPLDVVCSRPQVVGWEEPHAAICISHSQPAIACRQG